MTAVFFDGCVCLVTVFMCADMTREDALAALQIRAAPGNGGGALTTWCLLYSEATCTGKQLTM